MECRCQCHESPIQNKNSPSLHPLFQICEGQNWEKSTDPRANTTTAQPHLQLDQKSLGSSLKAPCYGSSVGVFGRQPPLMGTTGSVQPAEISPEHLQSQLEHQESQLWSSPL